MCAEWMEEGPGLELRKDPAKEYDLASKAVVGSDRWEKTC